MTVRARFTKALEERERKKEVYRRGRAAQTRIAITDLERSLAEGKDRERLQSLKEERSKMKKKARDKKLAPLKQIAARFSEGVKNGRKQPFTSNNPLFSGTAGNSPLTTYNPENPLMPRMKAEQKPKKKYRKKVVTYYE